MAESYSDMSLEPRAHASDLTTPRTPPLRIVDPETGFRGKPKTAAERIKHHLSVYERLVGDPNPADIKQVLELTEAILQDAQDLVGEAQQLRSTMLASILGLNPKTISPQRLDKLIAGISQHIGSAGPRPAT